VWGRGAISLERQVRIAAGSLVLIGLILGFFVHRVFFGLSAFVGAGLVFAGICGCRQHERLVQRAEVDVQGPRPDRSRRALSKTSASGVHFNWAFQLEHLLQKSITQFRYAPTLEFLAGLIPTAKEFTDFPDWDTTGVSINLKDSKSLCSLSITAQAYSYDQDSNDSGLEAARLSAAIERLPSGLGIRAYTRMGYRQVYLVPLDMGFESLVRVLSVKLLASNNELREILPSRLED
jgi:hypothetical protein